jgi:multidrug efflux pump
MSASEVIRRLEPVLEKVQDIKLFMQPVQDLTVEDRVSRTQYQFSMEDADAKELAYWVPKFLDRIKTIPVLRDVASDQQLSGLQTRLVIDRATASRLGITPQMLDDALYDAFGQRQISTIYTDLNQYHVILENKPGMSTGAEALNNVFLRSAAGGSVPLSAITRIETSTAPLAVNHQGQFPVVTISFNLAPRASIGDAVKAIEQARDELQIPPSIDAQFLGTAQAFRLSLVNTPFLILAALVTMYLLLGILYESYIHPVTILSTLPSAGVGALLSLMLFGIDFSVIALIGIILLIGIVKKNAIFQASLLRFRPIMMTTMAALLGAVPLALGNGVGSELRRPLGISIIGGLIFSQVLTLYTTPVIYLAFDRTARRLFPGRNKAPARLEPAENL